MGAIYYGSSTTPIQLDDRILAHLRVVVTTKLRRGESFLLSWEQSDGERSTHSSIWLHPSIPLRFDCAVSHDQPLDGTLLAQLAAEANTAGGIVITGARAGD